MTKGCGITFAGSLTVETSCRSSAAIRTDRGGGRFGQSLTAIARLAPGAVIAPGLSVHYSGCAGLPGIIRTWLESRGILTNSRD